MPYSVDQESDVAAGISSPELLNGRLTRFPSRCGDRQSGERLCRAWRVDPAKHVDRPALPPGTSVEDPEQRAHGAGVAHLRELSSGLGLPCRILEPALPSGQERAPVPISLFLALDLGLLGRDLFLVHPASLIPAAAQAQPGGPIAGIQAGDLSEMSR